MFRIRVGREIHSAALIADGYHARTDGLTSLAVVLGASAYGSAFRSPIRSSACSSPRDLRHRLAVGEAVLTRMLDGVEPGITEEIRHAAEHVPSVERVLDVKTRWLGHRLHADVAIAVPGDLSMAAAEGIAGTLRRELLAHLPALRTTNITFGDPNTVAAGADAMPGHGHSHVHHA